MSRCPAEVVGGIGFWREDTYQCAGEAGHRGEHAVAVSPQAVVTWPNRADYGFPEVTAEDVAQSRAAYARMQAELG